MPRPPVDAANRKRALQACIPCKASKKRCDSKLPCLNCAKRKDGGSCTYSHPEKPRIPASVSLSSPSTSRGARRDGANGVTVGDETRVAGRLLWSSRGNQVYVGDSASLAFLHLLRDMFTRYMGPSAFTTSMEKCYMLESRTGRSSGQEGGLPYGLDMDDMTELVDTYFAATCGILELLSREEIMTSIKTDSFGNSDMTIQDAIVYAIIAIGAQCRAQKPMDRSYERFHFTRAQKFAFANMLEDPSINMVRLFLILGFYMLGACQRNAAFMYIGVAARAACVLGLHHDDAYSQVPSVERSTRLTLWKSVRILDLLTASLLGRPPATTDHGVMALKNNATNVEKKSHRHLCFDATYGIWSIIDHVVQKFYQENSCDLSSATSSLSTVRSWSENLDPTLKTHNTTEAAPLRNKEMAIGNLHLACSYYYAVMLATRKYLVSHLASKLEASKPMPETDVAEPNAQPSEMAKMAQACIDSAILTLQTCREVCNAGMLLNNMCLLKAWIFAGGLILGFAMFTQQNPDHNMEAAYCGANEVLSRLAPCSPQAKHYHDILTTLLNAIHEHHQRVSLKEHQSKDTFVEKIFSMSSPLGPGPSSRNGQPFTSSNFYSEDSTWAESADSAFISSESGVEDAGSMAFDGMDSIAVQLWDEFVLGQDFDANQWTD